MSFLNPLFLVALAGIAAPILIHLLSRDRIQYATFSTLRFFAKGAKMVVRRRKFQEMLLLSLRVALVVLLALVFARPFFGAKSVDSRHEYDTAKVLVMDVSGSMRRPGLPEALKAAADDALSDGQEVGLITFSDTPAIAVPLGEPAPVKQAADAVTPGYGGTNIAEALRKANELLGGVRAKQKEIVLISDLQRQGWNYNGNWKLSSGVKLTINQVKPTDVGKGLGIVQMSAPNSLVLDKQPSSIAVRIANYSGQPQTNVPVALWLGDKKVDSQQVNLPAKGSVAVRFRHVFDAPGDNPGLIVVGSDSSTPDNTAYFNAHTVPRIPVLLIDGKPSSNPQADAAFFIGKALVPSDESPFTVTTVPADKVSPQDVAGSTVAILANVGPVHPQVAEALEALLSRGGGVFFLPGDQVKPEEFNAEFGKIAPCKLRQILQARPANGETDESLTRINFDHPIFDVFSLPHHGDLGLPKFAHYWETTDTQLSHILARFGDDRPAILERAVGKGDSLALVSAIDPNWCNFAYQSVFLPFVHQAVRYLAVQTGQQTNFSSGDLLPVPDGDSLKSPQGQTLAETLTGATKSGYHAEVPGFYRAINPQGGQDICLAVNGSMSEGDPDTVAGDEIAAAIEPGANQTLGGFDGGAAPASDGIAPKNVDHLWWYLLAVMVALTYAELVVGNKTMRH